MKSFTLSDEQIIRVIGALIADEVARCSSRQFDFATLASWNADTMLNDAGVDLSPEELTLCAARAAEFFGKSPQLLSRPEKLSLGDWASLVVDAINRELSEFAFKSSAREDSDALHRHQADEIYQDAAAAANICYGRRRLLSLVSPHSLLGFELTLLAPNLQGIESVDARGMPPDALTRTLLYGDALVATPTLWRYMMRERLVAPDNAMAVSFGEPLAPDLAAEMRKAGFSVLREIYGSTETGLMGWRDAPTEAFLLFDHWTREGDDAVRLSPDGSRRKTPAVDFVSWTDDRSFRLAGRRDGAVQIGAVNVHPEDVARQLRQHPAVSECMIRVNQSGDGVTRLVAHVVLRESFPPNERTARDIDAWCRTSLRQQERPRIYQFHRALAAS